MSDLALSQHGSTPSRRVATDTAAAAAADSSDMESDDNDESDDDEVWSPRQASEETASFTESIFMPDMDAKRNKYPVDGSIERRFEDKGNSYRGTVVDLWVESNGALVFVIDYEGAVCGDLTFEEMEGDMSEMTTTLLMTTPSHSSRWKAPTKALFGTSEQELFLVYSSDRSLLRIIIRFPILVSLLK
jgi:hypothetical protein